MIRSGKKSPTGAGPAMFSASVLAALFISLRGASALAQPGGVGEDEGEKAAGGRAIELITVTARKKEERLQDAPLAISAKSGAQLERAGIESFDQLLNTLPNTGQSGGIAGSIQGLVSIRGISTLIRFVGIETGVGFYVDGVYMGRPENFNQDLIDIERIEVLRGPQGALFGKNTIAGAINIITQAPADELSGVVEAQYGNYEHTRLRAQVSGPLLGDSLAASLSAGYVSRDGFVKHIGGGGDLDTAHLGTLRGKLRINPGERAQITVSADALRDRGDPVFFEVADNAFIDDPAEATPFTTNHEFPNFLDRDIWGLSLNGTFDFDSGALSAVVGWRDSEWQASLDDDKSPLEVFPDRFSQDSDVTTAELRFSASPGARFDYIVGAYYYRQKSRGFGDFALGEFLTRTPGLRVPITLNSGVDSESYALFFNTNYALSDRWALEVGGRWLAESKDAFHDQDDASGLFGSTNFRRRRTDRDFSPTLSLAYDIARRSTAYLRYARGFKSAGFNVDFVTPGVSKLEVAPEFATSYEVGIKSVLLDGALTANVAAFHTRYEDLQLSQIVGAGVSLNNAAEAGISGLEAEFAAAVGERIDIDASLGYLDATYEDFPNCPQPGAADPRFVLASCSGNFLNLAPEWTAAIGMQYRHPIGDWGDLIVRADWNYRSEVFFEPQNEPRLRGQSRRLLDLRAGVVNERWELLAWSRNLGNTLYVNFADDRSVIGANLTQAFGAPRTYGLTLRVRF